MRSSSRYVRYTYTKQRYTGRARDVAVNMAMVRGLLNMPDSERRKAGLKIPLSVKRGMRCSQTVDKVWSRIADTAFPKPENASGASASGYEKGYFS